MSRTEQAQAHAGVLRVVPLAPGATRIVLVRHGEAECNLNRVVGGVKGCTGLTDLGRRQVAALADRLYESGELRGASALYSSVLPRAVETAERLRPVVGPGPTALGPVLERCDLCELHPGESDGMSWDDMVDVFGVPDWDRDPGAPLAAGQSAHCVRGSDDEARPALTPRRHRGELIVAAVHAGVIEACLISFLGVPADLYRRGWVHIVHASMTEIAWVPDGDRFILLRFNDACGIPSR